jgi:DNA-nicking Smr family endonuclease
VPRRRLSAEEEALWRKVAATASPLRADPPVFARDTDPAPVLDARPAPARPLVLPPRPARIRAV